MVPREASLTPSMYLYVYVCVLLRVGKKAKRSLGIFLIIWTLTHTKKGPGEEGINIKKSLSQKFSALPWGLSFPQNQKCLSSNHEHARSFFNGEVGCQHSINQKKQKKKQEYLNGKILPSQYFSP